MTNPHISTKKQMKINSQKYSRRDMLAKLGGTAAVAALSPFIPLLEADAQTNQPLRYLYWYTPVHPFTDLVNKMLPKNEGRLQWRGAYSPLNKMQDKMSLFRGLTNTVANETNNAGVGGGHRPSGLTMISGWPGRKNKLAGDTALNRNGAGFHGQSTLDQWLADNLRQQKNIMTPHRDIRLGYRSWAHEEGVASWETISYHKGVAKSRLPSPAALFRQLYNSTNTTDSHIDQKSSVINHVYQDVKNFQKKLSPSDRQRLEQHLQSLDEIERQLSAPNISQTPCIAPNSSLNIEQDATMDDVADAYIQLIALAFSCDTTRIAGVQWLSHLSDNVLKGFKSPYSFLPEYGPVRQDHHGTTHDSGNGTKAEKEAFLNAISRFRAQIFVKLCERLDSIIDPNGQSVLDNTIAHWYIEVSSDHHWHDQFNVIAGGGNYFKMGEHRIVGTTEKSDTWSQTRLLTSIAHAFDLSTEGLIDPNYDNGALPSSVLRG